MSEGVPDKLLAQSKEIVIKMKEFKKEVTEDAILIAE